MAPLKFSQALNTTATVGKSSDPKRFRDRANEEIFAELGNRVLLKPWKIINEDVKHLGIRCFDLMRNAGLGCMMDMDKQIYPTLVREFFCNLQFSNDELKAKFLLRGKTGTLSLELLGEIIGYIDSAYSIKIFDKINFPGYEKKRAILSITGSQSKNASYGNMDVESQIMFHALCHLITPKFFKQNSANAREIFYLWCIKNGYKLNVPFIILSHMKAFLSGDLKDIPFAMIVTKIASHLKIDLSNEKDKLSVGLTYAYHLKFLRGKLGLLKSEVEESEETESEEKLIDMRKRKRSIEGSTSRRVMRRPRKPVTVFEDSPLEDKEEEEEAATMVTEKLVSADEQEESSADKTEEKEEEKEGSVEEEETAHEEVEENKEKGDDEEESTEKEGTKEENKERSAERGMEIDREAGQFEEPFVHPMDKNSSPATEIFNTPQVSKGKEVMDEEVQNEESHEADLSPEMQILTTISDQLEVSNKRAMELAQAMTHGFLMFDRRLHQLEVNYSEILKKLEESHKEKIATDEAIMESISKLSTKIPEPAVVKQEKHSSILTKIAARKLASRRELSTPSQIPFVSRNWFRDESV